MTGEERTEAATESCPEHDQPLLEPRQCRALAVVLGWRESTVVHACEGRFEMRRGTVWDLDA